MEECYALCGNILVAMRFDKSFTDCQILVAAAVHQPVCTTVRLSRSNGIVKAHSDLLPRSKHIATVITYVELLDRHCTLAMKPVVLGKGMHLLISASPRK